MIQMKLVEAVTVFVLVPHLAEVEAEVRQAVHTVPLRCEHSSCGLEQELRPWNKYRGLATKIDFNHLFDMHLTYCRGEFQVRA